MRENPVALERRDSGRQTKADVREELRAEAAIAFQPVQRCISYIDTVDILLKYPLEKDEVRSLSQKLGRRLVLSRSKSFQYRYKMHVQQPSAELIEHLSKRLPKHLISRFDLAFDFVMPDKDSADSLQVFLNQHLTQTWHGNRRMNIYETTAYFSESWQRRNIAVYSDCVSKKCDSPATHVEFRFYSSEVCRTLYGVSRIDDLNGLDHAAIFHRNCRLSSCIWPLFDRAIDEFAGKALRNYNHTARVSVDREWITNRMWKIFARANQDEEGAPTQEQKAEVPVQRWIEAAPHQERWLVQIPIDTSLIKSPESHI